MKILSFILSFALLSEIYCMPIKEEKIPNNFYIVKNSPLLSYTAEFSFQKNDHSFGKVIRSGLLCPRYYYDLYDNDNNFLARGITRFLSLGFFSENLMEIDVYHPDGSYIGSIEGSFITKSRAKFSFYSYSANPVAFAYLDDKKPDFLIVDANNPTNIIASMKSETFGEAGIINVEINSNINEYLLKIFGSFISDYNESFLEKPKEIHHHHYYYTETDNNR